VDGEDGGQDAIALARILRAEDGRLTLTHVYLGDPCIGRGSTAAYEEAERARSRELLENAREETGIEAAVRRHASSSVGRGLHELAEAVGADLLVIGSSRRGLLGRVLIGDDTRASMNGAPCAVAIAPAGYGKHPVVMREVGVGYDGSPESEHALGVARRLADAHRTKLSAFMAESLPANAYPFAGVAPVDEAYEQLVDDARRRVAALDGVEPHAAYGHPAEELALYSASLDLLVIGSRSYGPIGRLVHGSTAQQLARTARCPLLVLTRAARKADATGASGNGRAAVAAGAGT
jgi:nucleotide-binding universal stress UspA family protein